MYRPTVEMKRLTRAHTEVKYKTAFGHQFECSFYCPMMSYGDRQVHNHASGSAIIPKIPEAGGIAGKEVEHALRSFGRRNLSPWIFGSVT